MNVKTLVVLVVFEFVYVTARCTVDRCISIVPYFTCTVCTFGNVTGSVSLDEGQYIVATLDSGNVSRFTQETIQNFKAQVVNVNVNSTGLQWIERYAFEGFKNMKMLNLPYNQLVRIQNETLNGLDALSVLNISHNLIVDVDSAAFEGLVRLETLDLSYNYLAKLGRAFNSLPSLVYLKLTGNRLTSPYLPKTLVRLQTADFSCNEITRVEKHNLENSPRLTGIYLRSNKIRLIAGDVFSTLKNLKYIDVSSNRIPMLDSSIFASLIYLEKLNVSHNYITCATKNVIITSSRIAIDMSSNNVSNDCVIFKTTNDIQALSYSRNRLTELHKSSFDSAPNITRLDLSDNSIQLIPTAYFSHQRFLKHLDISNNSLTGLQIGSLLGLERLEELNLSRNRLTTIAEIVFHNTPQLQRLDLSNNLIETMDASGLVQITDLVRVDIHNNAMKCFVLSDIVRKFKSARVNVVYGPEKNKNGVHGIFCDDTLEDFVLYNSDVSEGDSFKRRDAKLDELTEEIKTVLEHVTDSKNGVVLILMLLVQIMLLFFVAGVVYLKYGHRLRTGYGRVEKRGVVYEEESMI